LRLRTLFDPEKILGPEVIVSLMWDYVQKQSNLAAMKRLQSQLLAMEGIKEKSAQSFSHSETQPTGQGA
jgi:hypothetical protein